MKTQNEYLATGGNECPMCESGEIEGYAIDIDSNYASQEVNCLACGAVWLDGYTLTGYMLIDPGTQNDKPDDPTLDN